MKLLGCGPRGELLLFCAFGVWLCHRGYSGMSARVSFHTSERVLNILYATLVS